MSDITAEGRRVLSTLSKHGVMTPIEIAVEQLEPTSEVEKTVEELEGKGLLGVRRLTDSPGGNAYVISSAGSDALKRDKDDG